METYHKIQTLFKRDMDGSLTGHKGKMIEGQWTTPELEYLAGNQWEFTEKVDGTNIRIGFTVTDDKPYFRGRTDNAQLPPHLGQYLDGMLSLNTIRDTFTAPSNVVLFGEGYGPKIQKGGGNYRSDASFVLFDVKVGDWWLARKDVDDIARKLGIDSVPTIGYGTLYDAVEIVSGRDESYGLFNNALASQWGDFEAEGIVARPVVPMFDRKGTRIITKIKCVDFKT